MKYPSGISFEEQRRKIHFYKERLKDFYLQIGIEPIKEMIGDLCCSAEMIEPNKNIHSLLRFMNGNYRLKITGNLGGAITVKTMAEIIRRMAEWSFNIQLPEEDTLGFGVFLDGVKEDLYGSKRIFDTYPLVSKREFLRDLGLDAAVRIRIYVEGQTEYAAFSHFLKYRQQIEVIDLGGQFVQKNKKGIGFRDGLIQDASSGIFSMIILDGDRSDNIRAVKIAAEEDLFCGQFYIFNPDFEFCNFSTKELGEIIINIISKEEDSEQLYESLQEVIDETTNADALMIVVKQAIPSLSNFSKGIYWGESLAKFAAQKPEFNNSQKIRPFIEACQTAILSINADFLTTRTKLRTDSFSGKLVKRKD